MCLKVCRLPSLVLLWIKIGYSVRQGEGVKIGPSSSSACFVVTRRIGSLFRFTRVSIFYVSCRNGLGSLILRCWRRRLPCVSRWLSVRTIFVVCRSALPSTRCCLSVNETIGVLLMKQYTHKTSSSCFSLLCCSKREVIRVGTFRPPMEGFFGGAASVLLCRGRRRFRVYVRRHVAPIHRFTCVRLCQIVVRVIASRRVPGPLLDGQNLFCLKLNVRQVLLWVYGPVVA